MADKQNEKKHLLAQLIKVTEDAVNAVNAFDTDRLLELLNKRQSVMNLWSQKFHCPDISTSHDKSIQAIGKHLINKNNELAQILVEKKDELKQKLTLRNSAKNTLSAYGSGVPQVEGYFIDNKK